jgi:hypothetical protein
MKSFLYWNAILVIALLFSSGTSALAETLPVQLDYEESYLMVRPNHTMPKRLWLSNNSYSDITVKIVLDEELSRIPEGWSVDFSAPEEFVGANARARVNIKVTTNGKAGFAKIVVHGESNGLKTEYTTLNVLSENAKYVLLNLIKFKGMEVSPAMAAYEETLAELPAFKDSYAMIDYDKDLLTAAMNTIEAVIFPISGGHVINGSYNPNDAGNPLAVTDASLNYPNLAAEMARLVEMKKKVLVFSPTSLWWTFAPSSGQIGKHADAVHFLKNMLGIEFENQIFRAQNMDWQGNIFKLNGFYNDSLGQSFAGTMNLTSSLATLYTDIIKIMPNSPAEKAYYADENTDHIVGVRSDKGDAKIVFNSFALEAFLSSDERRKILDADLKWLTGATDPHVKMPILNTPAALIFNEVYLGETRTYTTTLANEGDTTLIITNIEILDSEEGFGLDELEFPISIEPGKTMPLVVHFTPNSERLFESNLLVVSNSYNEPDIWSMVELHGEGVKKSTSVEENSSYGNLAVMPNPATGEFTIRYSLPNDIRSETRVTIMNALGQSLLQHTFKNTAAGEYSERFSTENLPSGRYEILIQNGLEVNRLPLLIVR